MSEPRERCDNSMPTLTLTPMTKSQAGKLVKTMLGSYPSLSLHDPQTYVAAVCALLTKYPLWAGENAIRAALVGEESKFIPPTLGILRPLLEDEVRVQRYAAEWDRRAHEQVLALSAPERPPRPTYAELKAKHGPDWGIRREGEIAAAKSAHLEAIRKGNERALAGMGGTISAGIPITAALITTLKNRSGQGGV